MNVAKKMIDLGIRVSNDHRLYCGDLKVSVIGLAKASNVDRKAVMATISSVLKDEYLSIIFKNIIPAGTLLKNIAQNLGLGAIEIETKKDNNGILAEVSGFLSFKNVGIRQAYANDAEMEGSPILTIITEISVPDNLIKEILKIEGVTRVSIY
ncbi:MAG: amino acid-binding protein [Methanobrevibacter sp.]|nr:amino acid-binding protein [Candidatus Methanovirga basalitermitum]